MTTRLESFDSRNMKRERETMEAIALSVCPTRRAQVMSQRLILARLAIDDSSLLMNRVR
jgi:hypothetical protein